MARSGEAGPVLNAPPELGIVPDESGLALGGNRVLRTRLGRLDVMQDVAGVSGYDGLAREAVEHEVSGARVGAMAGPRAPM